jgi:hypothetical protein
MLLVEKPGMGRSPCFAPAVFEGTAEPGSFLRARIVGADVQHLIADPLA